MTATSLANPYITVYLTLIYLLSCKYLVSTLLFHKLYNLFKNFTNDNITSETFASLSIEQVKSWIKLSDLDPANTEEYEYYIFSQSDIRLDMCFYEDIFYTILMISWRLTFYCTWSKEVCIVSTDQNVVILNSHCFCSYMHVTSINFFKKNSSVTSTNTNKMNFVFVSEMIDTLMESEETFGKEAFKNAYKVHQQVMKLCIQWIFSIHFCHKRMILRHKSLIKAIWMLHQKNVLAKLCVAFSDC